MDSPRNWSWMAASVAPTATRTPISRVRSVHRNEHHVHDPNSSHDQENGQSLAGVELSLNDVFSDES